MDRIPIDFSIDGCTYGGEFIRVAPDVWDLYVCGNQYHGQIALMDDGRWKFTPFDWSWMSEQLGRYMVFWWESNAYLMR